jgi:hypothetical protein
MLVWNSKGRSPIRSVIKTVEKKRCHFFIFDKSFILSKENRGGPAYSGISASLQKDGKI